MNTMNWLNKNVHGFADLNQAERQAIFEFSMLWSFFEAKIFNTQASSNAILARVHKWESQGILNPVPFEEGLSYFRQRYFQNDSFTEQFKGLHLRNSDNPDLVEAVIKGINTNPADSISVLLIVIYRLRNNLFHGNKWSYGICDQLENFSNANDALINALSING
jgi:hypothetical protein